ncbi:SOS response-associated peptidase [Mesorhizobium qingshengii]|uniref:Abasic site processing protein n=1 Tax=Mesorhizobium qingshengii TaxID=1165689 RepID=A0ABT4R4A3_9HYPH|nr:SOS response-associated peptidase family protein [Mesorhizobium qingshengii]MCZ8548652.1 SOS response-associated peptidase [Mesorhizobium qingshengii]
MPVDGYFESQKLDPSGKKKHPYAMAMESGELFAIAGIWEEYTDKATGELVRTFAIVSCEPNALIATIHDRMPVILPPSHHMRWLGPVSDTRDLMKPFPSELMKMWPNLPTTRQTSATRSASGRPTSSMSDARKRLKDITDQDAPLILWNGAGPARPPAAG